MKMLGWWCCVLLTPALVAQPPAPAKARALTAEEQKELVRLGQELSRKIGAGEFAEVAKTAQRIADYRAERQGESHWEVVNDRWTAKTWQRPAAEGAEVKRAMDVGLAGRKLQMNFRYAEAEAKYREALALFQKVLGEQHPQVAKMSYEAAFCLNLQAKPAQALPLFEKALAVRQKVLGEQHPLTGASYNDVADCLGKQGQFAQALPLFEKALSIQHAALGEEHPSTITICGNLANCLEVLNKHAEALPHFQTVLAARRKKLGDEHLDTAEFFQKVAYSLNDQGKPAEALPYFQKALTVREKLLGDQNVVTMSSYNGLALCLNDLGKHAEALPLHKKTHGFNKFFWGESHANTGLSYNNIAISLSGQGKHAEALPFFQNALTIQQRVLGEEHRHTALTYNNLAMCLEYQGKHAEALPLCEKALAIRRKVFGELHAATAQSYSNTAGCLESLGKRSEALDLYQKTLEIQRKILGEGHTDTAKGYSNVGFCLITLGKHDEALPLHEKALKIRLAALKDHPDTAVSYEFVGSCLEKQGKHAEALELFQKALAIQEKILGRQHPHTANSHVLVADSFQRQGKDAEAARHFEAALLGHEFGRLKVADTAFERALFRADKTSPRARLSACLVRLDQPLPAWEHAESDFARGLLDAFAPGGDAATDAGKLAHLDKLDQALVPLLVREKLSAEETKERDGWLQERDALLAELAKHAARRSRERVLALAEVQRQVPAEAAIVFWLDTPDQHLGCIVRREGPPVWVKLRGAGADDAWTAADDALPEKALAALADGGGKAADPHKLLEALRRQRLAPLEPHLKGVKRLLVVPAGTMSAVPVEALSEARVVSYIPSASVFARQMEKHRPLEASSLLVLADPVFARIALKYADPPPHGILVRAVLPGSAAAKASMSPGDVLLEYNGTKLTVFEDLKTVADGLAPIKFWREGKELAGRVPAGKLGVVLDKMPVAQALATWRQQLGAVATLGRGDDWKALPGTRLEARTLAGLIPATELLGSDASEQKLDELASSGQLKKFRLLHLATHGQANKVRPEQTALILAQDALPQPAEAAALVLAGKKAPEGRLTVATILRHWELDADLVVLSACETGLGKKTAGEGMLGFTQALMQKGARAVVLSRWKVDDAATALLMARFYENLAGKRAGLAQPLKRAPAMAEAQSWLRQLPRADAEKRLAALVDGVPRGERGTIKAALPTSTAGAPQAEDRPFAHPYYWAAFVLIGDPE